MIDLYLSSAPNHHFNFGACIFFDSDGHFFGSNFPRFPFSAICSSKLHFFLSYVFDTSSFLKWNGWLLRESNAFFMKRWDFVLTATYHKWRGLGMHKRKVRLLAFIFFIDLLIAALLNLSIYRSASNIRNWDGGCKSHFLVRVGLLISHNGWPIASHAYSQGRLI